MIFLYEFVTGGGCYSLAGAPMPAGSLLREGRLMAQAAAKDLARIGGVRVCRLVDSRLNEPAISGCQHQNVADADAEEREFKRLAAAASGTLVIAPETGGALLERVRWTLAADGRLLGPGLGLVELAADKHLLAEHLRRAGVPAPRGQIVAAREPLPEDFTYPAVLKPLDGAGSRETRLVARWNAAERGLASPARLEAFCPGVAASVAVLCGPGVRAALPPCEQRLSADGRFRFLGARTPLSAPLAARAEALALGAIDSLGRLEPRGYLGVDLVLGQGEFGAEDVVIEVNPRLTTSFVALRQAVDANLMAVMLATLEGRRARLCPSSRTVKFEL